MFRMLKYSPELLYFISSNFLVPSDDHRASHYEGMHVDGHPVMPYLDCTQAGS